jgi:DNA-binding transcriptional LysR family regulator
VLELRQLRYFVTLAEELHFGRAASREHIAQSALSQQVQRLERGLGVRLVERNTHRVQLTAAGAAFLVEARQVLAQTSYAAAKARDVAGSSPELRVGILDACYDLMPQILDQVQFRYPALVIHQVEVSEPMEYQMLADGRLDIGMGRPTLVHKAVASQLLREDLLGILLPEGHRLAELGQVPIAELAGETLLFAEGAQVPRFIEFVAEKCRSAGFTPMTYAGTVMSIRAAAELVARRRCVCCLPLSCAPALPGTIWQPLIEPLSYYPWSILWRADDASDYVREILACAQSVSRNLGWLSLGRKILN